MLLPYVFFVFCMSEDISSFRSLRAGSQVFALLMLFLCVILHNMPSRKSLQLLCIFPFGMLCLSAISMVFVKCVWLGAGWEMFGVSGRQDWVWALPILEEHGENGICVLCFGCGGVCGVGGESEWTAWARVW